MSDKEKIIVNKRIAGKMVKMTEGDIFDMDVQYIAHQCNCLTSHSAGFANVVFKRFPGSDIYKDREYPVDWKNLPENQKPSQIIVKGKIINMLAQVFPGKPKYDTGIDSPDRRKEYFKDCLDQISKIDGLKSVAFPHGIGCNMGGGKWSDYLEMLEEFAKSNPEINVFIVKKD